MNEKELQSELISMVEDTKNTIEKLGYDANAVFNELGGVYGVNISNYKKSESRSDMLAMLHELGGFYECAVNGYRYKKACLEK